MLNITSIKLIYKCLIFRTPLNNSLKKDISKKEFENLESEFKYWREEVEELLKQRFNNQDNEYYKKFENAGSFNMKSMSAAMRGANPSDIRFRYEFFTDKVRPKVENLISLEKKLKYIPVEKNINMIETELEKNNKKIFISHSSLDSDLVEKLIDILEAIGVQSSNIFCSSFEGYGVRLGSDFLETIKTELNNDVLVLFVLSSNFYSSTVSLCEMGATWVKTNEHIPILIPPFDYKDVKGVIPTTHGMKINEKTKFNSLKEIVETFMNLPTLNFSSWERKRDNILKDIKKILDDKINSNTLSIVDLEKETKQSKKEEDYFDNALARIKELSRKEWTDDYEMQLNHIETQQKAIIELKQHNPIDIPTDVFSKIRKIARKDWPDDYEMQLDYEKRQVESLRRLNKL